MEICENGGEAAGKGFTALAREIGVVLRMSDSQADETTARVIQETVKLDFTFIMVNLGFRMNMKRVAAGAG